MKIFIALLVLALLIYITVIYWVFKYTFAKKRGPMAVILKNTKLGGNFLEGYEGIIAQGVEWAKSQPFTDEYTISNDGLKLHGYFLENKGSERTVICVHGYRSSGFADFSVALRDLYNLGNNLLVIDQRSRGKSEGKYITFGVKEGDDCICWANHMLKTRGASHKVFFDGVSMGASSVITACGKGVPENVHGIIADSGFSCPCDIISKVMGDTLKKESKLIMNSLNMMKQHSIFSLYMKKLI